MTAATGSGTVPAGVPDPDPLALLIRQVFANPHSELAVREQMTSLARENLHRPEVLAALVEVLPEVKATETRRQLLGILLGADPGRFADLGALHSSLLEVLAAESDRATRSAVLARLAAGMHQDERLLPALVDLLRSETMSDEEVLAVMRGLAQLPEVPQETAALALDKGRNAPFPVQELAMTVAEACPYWGDRLVGSLEPYLGLQADRRLRARALERLAGANLLSPRYMGALREILRKEPESSSRSAALSALGALTPWDEEATLQLLWTSQHDADPALRARAVQMQAEAPDLSDAQVALLAGQLSTEGLAQVRLQVLELLRGRLGQPSLREVVAASLAANPSAFALEELKALVGMLAPYASRDPQLRVALVGAVRGTRSAAQRSAALEALLSDVRTEDIAGALVDFLDQERQPEIRQMVFGRLRPLSVTKHPDLVRLYCAEVADPGSASRRDCAAALGVAIEVYPGIVAAFEDVLLHDRDRELARTCLDAYLRPGVARKAEVLLAVLGNDEVDLASRQRCLDAIDAAGLSPDESRGLAEFLASPSAAALKARGRP
jgi:hypothetical protein